MKSKNRNIICLIFAIIALLALIFGNLGFQKAAATERVTVDSGAWSDSDSDINWILYDDGELYISGNGNMHNSLGYSNQWSGHSSSVLKITVSEGITSICSSAFSKFDNLKSVTMKDGITSIGARAFFNCTSLNEIIIPKTVIDIGENAFYGCTALENVVISEGVSIIGAGSFGGCIGLTEISIPDTVTDIGKRAFFMCNNLESVSFGNGVNAIGEEAFGGCKKITDVELPDSLKTIGKKAFYDCSELKNIMMSANIQTIGGSAFKNTAFYSDYASWDNGFLYCGKALLAVDSEKIPENCKLYSKTEIIASAAFQNCTKITNIEFPANLKHINGSAFAGCENLESVTLPQNLESLGDYCFKGCEKINSIFIPDKVSIIGTETFAECGNLENIVLGIGVTAVKDKAFALTPKLKEIFIPATVTEVSSSAFENSGLTDIFYDDTKAEWKRTVSGASFEGITVHYTLKSDDKSVVIIHTDKNFNWEAGNVHLQIAELDSVTSKFHQNGFYSKLMVDPIQILDIKIVDGDGNGIQPLSNEKITVKIKADEDFKTIMKSELLSVSEYDIEAEKINFINDCFVFEVDGQTVSIPASESFLKSFSIIHWHSDADSLSDFESFTHDEITVINGYIVIETNHFSEYAVCTEYQESTNLTVTSVEIISLPNKTQYVYKIDSLDLNGIVLRVTYSDGTSENISDPEAVTTDGFGNNSVGKKTITVAYGGCTDEFEVTVSYTWWQWIIRILLLGFMWY